LCYFAQLRYVKHNIKTVEERYMSTFVIEVPNNKEKIDVVKKTKKN